MALNAQYAATPVISSTALTTAEASLTSPTNVSTLVTGSASGTRVHRIDFQATAATTPGMLRLFIHDGTSYRLFKEVLVNGVTPSATTEAWAFSLSDYNAPDFLPIVLPNASYSIRVTTEKSNAFNVIAHGGAF